MRFPQKGNSESKIGVSSVQQAANATPEILTPEEAAALLRVGIIWVHEKCRSRAKNPLPHHRVGKFLRFRRSELLKWFDDALTQKKSRAR